ncbi:MAG: GyrI-like domain-containing protein [Bacteroidetes bacterium]|nr:GyrI-like domain-containing protein [Bacteroidota bacterium]
MIEIEKDIRLLTVKAVRFPEGIQGAFDELRKRLPSGDDRMPYGISKPEKDGTIVYRAGVETETAGEEATEGLELVTLSKGIYASITISDWQRKIHTLSDIFENLLQHPQLDPATPCIEVYRSRTELVCMVRIKTGKGRSDSQNAERRQG